MMSAPSLAFILVFLVLQQGLTAAIVGGFFYAVLNRIPAKGWVKAGLTLSCAIAGAIIFAAMGNVSGTGPAYILVALFFIVSGPLIILSPIFILAEQKDYAPYAGLLSVIVSLFCAAAIAGVLQVLNITAFLSVGNPAFPPAVMYLFSFAIMGGVQIVLGAEFFIFACMVQRRRSEMHEDNA
ncbi:hypothetical protein L0665_05845 [Methanogenium marinum]|uniref:Uncharacterized protein n=1 Tax=Methanogenium marinum TaxID=348610 RepID=A0A9Q4KV96_9EURY|nr:hypothetical protein [Methanogenium marinum]MDE4908130.1 hypothetical protein [Methanogenium marinum]